MSHVFSNILKKRKAFRMMEAEKELKEEIREERKERERKG